MEHATAWEAATRHGLTCTNPSSQFSHAYVMSTDVGLPKFVKSMPSLIVLHGHAAVTLHRIQSVTIYGMGFMGFMGAFETE